LGQDEHYAQEDYQRQGKLQDKASYKNYKEYTCLTPSFHRPINYAECQIASKAQAPEGEVFRVEVSMGPKN